MEHRAGWTNGQTWRSHDQASRGKPDTARH
jgi:hypothetical protein